MIKQFEQYINSDIDPYNEEDWQDKLDIKEGDIVICINDVLSRGRLKKGLDYVVIDLLYNRGFLTLRGVKGAWAKHLLIKQSDNDEQFEQYEFDPIR